MSAENETAYNPKQVERGVKAWWRDNDTFRASIENRKGATPFIFLEGPPTANGKPHIGNIFTRVVKDAVLRYKTMQGHYVERKAGWDTHGLPVEIEVEKKLGLESKQDIEAHGVGAFNEECRNSVFTYEKEWRTATEDIGFWIDMDNPYITMATPYVESVWWSLKQLWDKKLLYKGHKVTPYCPRCGTSLSSHEVALGYKDVADPSVYVKFKLKNEEGAAFVAWTTTPWTLISNVALAVHPDFTYVRIKTIDGEHLIMAESRIAAVLGEDAEYDIVQRLTGADLEGVEYEQLFTYVKPEARAHFVILADFVTLDDGSGIVHIAPAFGEDDYNAAKRYELPVIQPVGLDGLFSDAVTDFAGMFVKDADIPIITMLDARGVLLKRQKYKHSYPFCWRCDTPLLYYARESWFVATTTFSDALVANNEKITWAPPHIKHGRFGDFLANVIDWSLSRDRYWGTPLPIWTCADCGARHCIGSIDELKRMSTTPLNDGEIDLHKPFIDGVTLRCESCGGSMVREPNVIDCWYDSGSAFFAQFHYPFENTELFEKNYPVDFISEGIDQTRGWFYSMHAVSSAVFGTNAYASCLTLELVLDEKGQKMSKSKGNVVNPADIIGDVGADALRWYLLSINAPWQPIKFDYKALKETANKYLTTVWNVASFFMTYADLDAFDAESHFIAPEQRTTLDRWLLSRMQTTAAAVETAMRSYELHKATRAIEQFVVADVSNWYVRRSRRRFWAETWNSDKKAAYSTLYEVLLAVLRFAAPFTPFVTEDRYQKLLAYTSDAYRAEHGMHGSIHLNDYPTADATHYDEALAGAMEHVRTLIEMGRALRAEAAIKTRWPLQTAYVVCDAERFASIAPLVDIMKDELNVKDITHTADVTEFQSMAVKPNHKKLGPHFRGQAKAVADAIHAADPVALLAGFDTAETVQITVDNKAVAITRDMVLVETVDKEAVKVAGGDDMTLVLDIALTDELRGEGMARELIRRIQDMRKQHGLNLDDYIEAYIAIDDGMHDLVRPHAALIAGETRSKALTFGSADAADGALVREWAIDDDAVTIAIRKA